MAVEDLPPIGKVGKAIALGLVLAFFGGIGLALYYNGVTFWQVLPYIIIIAAMWVACSFMSYEGP